MLQPGLGRTIAGFAIAPIAPGLVLAGLFLICGHNLDAEDAMRASAVLGYPIAIVLGLPIHLLFIRRRLTGWLFYLAAGAAIGAVVYLAMPMFVDAAMRWQGVDGGHMVFRRRCCRSRWLARRLRRSCSG